jgi:hypothetical protein
VISLFEYLVAVFFKKLPCLLAASCVRPVYGMSERHAVFVGYKKRVRCRINGNGGNVGGRDFAFVQNCFGVFKKRRNPILGILLRTSAAWMKRGIFNRVFGNYNAILSKKRCF